MIGCNRKSCHIRGMQTEKQFGVTGLKASEESCRILRDCVISKNFKAGETLFWEDDAADYVYLLVYGAIKCYKLLPNGRSQIARFTMAGDLMAPSSFAQHTYTAEALNDCNLLLIPRRKFDELLDQDPIIARSVAAKIAEELHQTQRQILMLGRMPAVERVSNFLLEFAEVQNGALDDASDEIMTVELPMTRTDIADYLGLTIETVSRVFSKFRRDKLIELPRPNMVRFCDQTGLADQAESLSA